jgi:hypothetical protein
MTKVFTIAHVPDELVRSWLQHLRDFDTAHPGCHFEVVADSPDATVTQMIKALDLDPPLVFTTIFERKQP